MIMSPDTAVAAPEMSAHETADNHPRRHDADAMTHVRASDIEPYIGLRYLSKLFRFMAIILVLLLAAEMITGLVKQGRASIPTLLGEMSRLIVLAGLLWGSGDLAILLIDIGHDVRAARILLGRQIAHHFVDQHPLPPPAHESASERRTPGVSTRE